MRCLACNALLTEFEATRRFHNSDEFVDLCNDCLYTTDIVADERLDLITPSDERIVESDNE